MQKCQFILVLLFFCAATASAQIKKHDFDPVLQHMENREKFIDAVRAYDRAQGYLVKADHLIADFYKKEGNMNMAQAKIKKANERIENVKSLYEIALGRYTDSAILHNYYGELLYDNYGNVTGALLEWNKALSYDSKLSQAYNNLGLHELHNGNYASGLRNLEQALELEPENPDYLFNLTQTYLIHGPQISEIKGMDKAKVYKQAMKMSEKAAKIAADEYELLQDYAVNFFAGENFEVEVDWKDAAKAWQSAREIARTSDERFYTWLNEARAWIKINHTAEAKRCLNEALAIRPESDIARGLLNKQELIPDGDAAAPADEQ